MNGRITPGSHPELSYDDVQNIADQWDIYDRTFEEAPSFTGRVFLTKDDSEELPGYVIKVPSSHHTPERIQLAQKLAEATTVALDTRSAVDPSFGRVAVQQFLSLPHQPDQYSVPVGDDGEHIAVMLDKLPGHTSTEQPPAIISIRQHASILGIMHSAMQAPGLVEFADTHKIGLERAEDYTNLYMGTLDENHPLLREMAPLVDKINEYWAELPTGVVPIDQWINNMLRNEQDQITAAIDLIDANKAPRLFDWSMGAFGLFAKNRSFRELQYFFETYAENVQPDITELEQKAWIDLTILRGYTSRHGAELVNPAGAKKDATTIHQLIDNAKANGAL